MPCASWAVSFFLLSRSKQQPIVTWGILNRVTESVKIVPQWLQSYFSRNEDVCSCSTDRREAAQQLENREDEHMINADEESANIHDGRITLSQQSVIQKSFEFCMLESPALNCQPSTSSASPSGSSGVFVVDEAKDCTSQHDDGNISTTRGVSLRAFAKDTAASQNTSVPLLWSLETEHHSLSWNMATSSKTPALNVSVIEAFPSELGNLRSLKQVIWEILVFILSKQGMVLQQVSSKSLMYETQNISLLIGVG
ncbi:nuclear pore complex protein Nup153-like [Hipposideros larvatus]